MIIRLELRELRDTKLAPKCPLQHRRQEGVQRGGVFRLRALECVGLRTAVAFGRTVPQWKEAGERGSCKTPARGLNGASEGVAEKQVNQTCRDCRLFRKRIYAQRWQFYLT